MLSRLRATLAISGIAGSLLVLGPLQAVALRLRLPWRRKIPIVFHRLGCRMLRLRGIERGTRLSDQPMLIIANHSSWLDIPVLGSRQPLCFVAKSEIAGWPLFGWLAKAQRSIFVERERRQATGDAARAMAETLAEGDPVVLFAEGTSNDGNRLLPFRSALVGAARDAIANGGHRRVTVQPVSIVYVRYGGLPMGRQMRARAAWYGDLDLVPHLRQVVAGAPIDVIVTYGPPLVFEAGSDRKRLTREAESILRAISGDTLRDPDGTRDLPTAFDRPAGQNR